MVVSPTPLQRLAMNECVVVHRQNMNNESPDTATIDAAPLIAIIDDYTGQTSVNPPYSPFREGGRYATLAAIVGISNSKTDDESYNEENFMDYMELCPLWEEELLSSSVRLIGVGRAVLRRFFYRIPTDLCSDEDASFEEEFELDYDVETYEIDDQKQIPIIMSDFEPLIDDASIYSMADPNRIGEIGEKSYRLSPVHALSALNNLSIRVCWMHDNRKTLVAGIKTAKARLRMYDDNLEDLDGLGSLFNESTNINSGEETKCRMTVDEFLATFKGNMLRIDPSELPQNQPSQLEKLEAMENYGLSYFGSLSSITDLAIEASERLKPYYSPSFQEREEYLLEVTSFIAFRVLEGFADPKDISWSLHCTSSIERLTRAYEILFYHTIQLKELAENVSKELEQCGEECIDIFPSL